MLEKLGLHVQVCHMNEGHAAFAVLARATSFAAQHGVSFPVALRATRAGNVFTTHTPVEAAFDRFEPALVMKYTEPFVRETGLTAEQFLAHWAARTRTTRRTFQHGLPGAARQLSCQRRGAAARPRRAGPCFTCSSPAGPRRRFPSATSPTGCTSPPGIRSRPTSSGGRPTAATAPGWASRGRRQGRGGVVRRTVWDYRAEARKTLVDYVRQRLERQRRERNAPEAMIQEARHVLDPNVLTLGFARRFAEYKRPNLLLYDRERFARILRNAERPVQIVVAGKGRIPATTGARP